MSEQKKSAAPVKPTVRRSGKPAVAAPVPVAVGEIAAAPAAAPAVSATAAATARARPARKPSRVDETVARHQKVLAEALTQAQAINYEPPQVVKAEAPKGRKAEKPTRAKKPKLVRDSYAMPEAEFARIGELKKRLAGLGRETKKSELLRAGIALLAALNDAELTAVMGRVERIKTGRPAK